MIFSEDILYDDILDDYLDTRYRLVAIYQSFWPPQTYPTRYPFSRFSHHPHIAAGIPFIHIANHPSVALDYPNHYTPS